MPPDLAKRIRRFLNPQLLSSAVVVGVLTMGVKGVAFLKELVVANRFGTSDEVDAFVVAMLIPAVVALAVGNAFRDALVPVYAEQRIRIGAEASRLVSNTIWNCGAVLIVVSLAALIFGEPLMDIMGSGFSEAKKSRSLDLFHMVIPYVMCVGVANLLKGYLQAHGRFALSSAAPVFIPLSIIMALLFMPGKPTGAWLAAGTSLGAVALLATLYIASRGIQHRWLLTRPSWDPATRSVLRNMAPLLAGAAIIESYFFIDTAMAAALPSGSVAILSYGERICGVFCLAGAAVVQALFPHVADLVAREAWKSLVRMVLGYSCLIVIFSLPIVLMCWFAAEHIVRILFEHGEFTATDTKNVSDVLRFAGLQVPVSILVVLAARMVMALRANHFVLISAVCGLVANVLLNLVFMRWFGVKGIALSTALVQALSAAMLFGYAGFRLRKLAI